MTTFALKKKEPEQEEKCLLGSAIFKNYLDMPVWQLRHLEVSRFIQRYQVKRVLDVGCAQGTLINRLSRSFEIETLIGIDFNKDVLQNARCNVQPELIQESIAFVRKAPLTVQLYHLDIFEALPLQKFKDVDLVTMIEFIEHIRQEDLPKLCDQIFRQIMPKYVMITTPNEQFNVHFNFKTGQMRHPEHLFEWKRRQFVDFAQRVCRNYGYEHQLFGIGEHANDDRLGPCSQGAFFKRISEVRLEEGENGINVQPFAEFRYPFWKDRLQLRIQSQLRSMIIKNNYAAPSEILELFQSSKLGRKIKEQDSGVSMELSERWLIEKIKGMKYCGYDEMRNQLFYEYEESDEEEENESLQ